MGARTKDKIAGLTHNSLSLTPFPSHSISFSHSFSLALYLLLSLYSSNPYLSLSLYLYLYVIVWKNQLSKKYFFLQFVRTKWLRMIVWVFASKICFLKMWKSLNFTLKVASHVKFLLIFEFKSLKVTATTVWIKFLEINLTESKKLCALKWTSWCYFNWKKKKLKG